MGVETRCGEMAGGVGGSQEVRGMEGGKEGNPGLGTAYANVLGQGNAVV